MGAAEPKEDTSEGSRMAVSSATVWAGTVQTPWLQRSTVEQSPHGTGPVLPSGLWLLLLLVS